MTTRARSLLRMTVSVGAVLGIEACSPTPLPTVAAPTEHYRFTATIRDLMVQLVDPAADALWDSVGITATRSGTDYRRPRTDKEWQAVRISAVTLIEAGNLLAMPDRRVAAVSPHDAPPGAGELALDEMQQRIDATHEGFVHFAQALRDGGQKALAAIDAKDAQGLMDAGAAIDRACEACHLTYWYPNRSGS